MTQQEVDAIINTIRTIPEGQSELARALLKAAADSMSLDKVAALTGMHIDKQSQNGLILKFTEKEILKMPKTFRQEFSRAAKTRLITKFAIGVTGITYPRQQSQLKKLKKNSLPNCSKRKNEVRIKPTVYLVCLVRSQITTSKNSTYVELRKQRTKIRSTVTITTLSIFSAT